MISKNVKTAKAFIIISLCLNSYMSYAAELKPEIEKPQIIYIDQYASITKTFRLDILKNWTRWPEPPTNVTSTSQFGMFFEDGVANYITSNVFASLSVQFASRTTSPGALVGSSGVKVSFIADEVYDEEDSEDTEPDIPLGTLDSYIPIQSGKVLVLNSNNNTVHKSFSLESYSFEIKSFWDPQYSFWFEKDNPVNLGSVLTNESYAVRHSYLVEKDSPLYKSADFFKDVKRDDASALEINYRNESVSEHIQSDIQKEVILNDDPLGIRGTIDSIGTTISTASPGILVYNLTFSEIVENIFLPFVFDFNKDLTTLEIFFNNDLLASLKGEMHEYGVLNFAEVDVSKFAGETGDLRYVLNTASKQSARVYIPEGLGMSAVTAVPEPESLGMMMAGLGLISLAQRRKKQLT